MTSVRLVVELPSHENDREGTLADIRDAILRLKHVSNEVFSRVEAQVAEETAKLGEMERRIEAVRNKIAALAAQPSKVTSLQIPSKLALAQPNLSSIYKELPIQSIGKPDVDEHRFKGRKNADQDEDPAVPLEALLDMDRRITASVALRIREAVEQTRELAQDIVNATIINESWFLNMEDGHFAEDMDEEDLGPAPASLRNMARASGEGENLNKLDAEMPADVTIGIDGSHHVDVGYRPRMKEAHHLGLPTSLSSLLPDIADPSSFLTTSRPQTLPLAPSMDETINEPVSTRPAQPSLVSPLSGSTKVDEKKPEKMVVPPATAISERKSSLAEDDQETRASPAKAAILPPMGLDQSRQALMAAIREARTPGKANRLKPSGEGGAAAGSSQAKTVKHPVTLADEMREKLARRQKALSGERDEEEQQAERMRRRKLGKADNNDDDSSDSGLSSSLPSYSPSHTMMPKARTTRVPSSDRSQPASAAPFAGLDALLNRQLSAKTPALLRPPPKPASTVGSWDDEE